MKESRHNSGTSLFLMEMILALLFLSLSSAACIQIFAAARKTGSRQNSEPDPGSHNLRGRDTGRH